MICRNPVVETGRYVQKRGEATIPRGHLQCGSGKTLIKHYFSMTLSSQGTWERRRGCPSRREELLGGTAVLGLWKSRHALGTSPAPCFPDKTPVPVRAAAGMGMCRPPLWAAGWGDKAQPALAGAPSSPKVWYVFVFPWGRKWAWGWENSLEREKGTLVCTFCMGLAFGSATRSRRPGGGSAPTHGLRAC